MGRPGGDSRAPGMQIAMHMSQMPEGLNGSEGRGGHVGIQGEQKKKVLIKENEHATQRETT